MSVVVPTILDFGRIVLNVMAYLLSVRLPKQREKAWRLVKSDLIAENAELKHEVDALQQAMSALSSGIYQNEAEEVLDRIGKVLTLMN
jgi:hypothetical protein